MFEVFDAHCHYQAAINSHIQHLAVASIKLEDIEHLVTLREFKPQSKIGCGIHPWFIESNLTSISIKQNIEMMILKHRPDFIGECGLDKLKDNFTFQLEVCEIHCQLATKYNLPIIFHCVRSYNELLQIISKYPHISGMIHGFNGNTEMAKQFIRKGFKIGIGSLIMQNSQIRKSIRNISLEGILIETDSPFMPMKLNKESKPEDGYLYCHELAKIKENNLEEVINKVNQNWNILFIK